MSVDDGREATNGKSRIVVDTDVCICSGMCTQMAPLEFALDAAGELVVLEAAPPPEDLDAVEAAVACCPVEAIRLERG